MRYVFAFEEGSKEQKYLLGGKGANLAEMTNLGLPVPPGFTITTEACNAYMAAGDQIPDGLMDEVAELAAPRSKPRWASSSVTPTDPLLVSVRSGAPFSMPGMMDTVLNLGLNDVSVGGLATADGRTRASRTTRTAGSCRCSARSCSTSTARSSSTRSPSCATQRGVATDPELSADDLRELVERFKAIVLGDAGIEFPQEPHRAAAATRSKPCSGAGTASARACTAGWRRSPTTSAPR